MKDVHVHSIPGALLLEKEATRKLAEIAAQGQEKNVFVVGPVHGLSYDLATSIRTSLHTDDEILLEGRQMWSSFVEDILGVSPASSRIQDVIASGIETCRGIVSVLTVSRQENDSISLYIDALVSHWLSLVCQAQLSVQGKSAAIVEYSRALEASRRDFQDQIILVYGDMRRPEAISEADAYGDALVEHAASHLASVLKASHVSFWNDHSPLRTADIEEVPGARIIEDLSFSEAVELSYFGAPVVHPRTLLAASEAGIPVCLRWWQDIAGKATTVAPVTDGVVASDSTANGKVKGISIIHNISLINIEGAGMSGVPGISARLFSAVREAGISVSFISQASSEYSICFAVDARQAEEAVLLSRDTFHVEVASGLIPRIESEADCAILAIVGDRMSGTPGIAARAFSALAKVGVNVRAIAQGSSERNISAVIKESDCRRALQGLHAGIFLSRRTLSVGILGIGGIGGTLLEQLCSQSERLHEEFGVDIRVRALANSTRMLLDEEGISLRSWRERFKKSSVPLDVDMLVEHITVPYYPHSVIFDCTSSAELPLKYIEWLEKGSHIITPNKKAGAGPYEAYEKLMATCRSTGRRFLYETTVGAGLPVINTLQDLIRTGDRVHRVEGIVSGTLAWLFSHYDGTQPFSSLVRQARELGYTEPDPRDDLSGMDVARKTVILAREMGYRVETDELSVTSLVPGQLRSADVPEFMSRLEELDAPMEKLYREAEARGERLRYVGCVDEQGTCSVALKSYPLDHPFAQTMGTNNVISYTTDRYHELPLVITGPGAGKEVTAAGVFADLLRLCAYLGARL